MRVITGTARGRKLITLEGEDVRPTTDRVKEALFSIIQFEIEGRRVLDLFAGSGQLGIEALSRGAQSATFVDINKDAIDIIRKNLKATHLEDLAKVFNADSVSFIKSQVNIYDIIFIDPPYGKGLVQKVLPYAADITTRGGIIVCEVPSKEELPQEVGNFKLYKRYNYGKTEIVIYRAEIVD